MNQNALRLTISTAWQRLQTLKSTRWDVVGACTPRLCCCNFDQSCLTTWTMCDPAWLQWTTVTWTQVTHPFTVMPATVQNMTTHIAT